MVQQTWWGRVRELVAFVLGLEPVAVQAVVRAAFVLGTTVGLVVTDDVQGRVLAAVAAFYALAELVGALWARSRVTPTWKVAETVDLDGRRVAGPASPLPTGATITGGAHEPDVD